MKKSANFRYGQKGHIPLPLILLIAVALAGWFIYHNGIHSTVLLNPSPTALLSYKDSGLKIDLAYTGDLEVVSETEDEYSKRTQTDYRKNFTGYVAYQPPKFVKSLIVKPKELKLGSSQFDVIPLTIWVFENPNKLTVDEWYKNYWYYPFVWGVFSYPQKQQIAPITEATVSGIMTKSAVIDYSPGKPKFVLVPKEEKMFLFRVMDGGDPILHSFKFQ